MYFRLRYTTTEFISNMFFSPIKDFNSYFVLVYMYKSLNELTFPANYYTLGNDNHNYDLRYPLNVRPPMYRNAQRRSSPSYYGCSLWNSLPLELRMKPSVASFKFSLKLHLLSQYN